MSNNTIFTAFLSLINGNNKSNISKKEPYIGSNRERITKEKKWAMSRKEFFLSDWNTKKLTNAIYHSYRDLVNGPFPRDYFITNVPKWMRKWCLVNKLDQYADHRYNFIDTFTLVNRKFIRSTVEKLRVGVNKVAYSDINISERDLDYDSQNRQCSNSSYQSGTNNNYYDMGEYYDPLPYFRTGLHSKRYENPSYMEPVLANEQIHENWTENGGTNLGEYVIDEIKREAAESTPKRKNYDVEDYRQLDVWDDNYGLYTDNSKYRYHNKIPGYRTHIQIRHYDRSNEGLRQREHLINDRFRKFDLSEIGYPDI